MYRPVPIDEHLVFESNIYAASSTSSMLKAATQLKTQDHKPTQPTSSPIRTIQSSQHKELKDVVLNSVVALTNETVRAGFGVLIFCSSRVGCESDARIVSLVLPAPGELDDVTAEKRADLLADLRSLPSGLDPVLAETVPAGVAFHRKCPIAKNAPKPLANQLQMQVFPNTNVGHCILMDTGGSDYRRTGLDCGRLRLRDSESDRCDM